MNIPLDWILVVSLTSTCIIFAIKSVKSHGKKTDAIITITTAFLTLVIYFFGDYNNARQQKELIAIYQRQLSNMQTVLGDKINALQAKKGLIEKELEDCRSTQSQTIIGKNNNTSQLHGHDNNSTQIQGQDNIGVSGSLNTVLKGGDGSTINYNTLDKPFFVKEVAISEYTNTGIPIFKGEKIVITANGSIKVGPLVGSSGPDGLVSGFLGASLESYDIVPEFKHAALMFKLSDGDSWTQCGSNYKFTADKSGYLIF